MAQQIAVSLVRTNEDIHGKLVAISKQMDVGAPGARRRAGRLSAPPGACIPQRKLEALDYLLGENLGDESGKKAAPPPPSIKTYGQVICRSPSIGDEELWRPNPPQERHYCP